MSKNQFGMVLFTANTLDFDTDRSGVFDRRQFLHTDTRNENAGVFKASGCNMLGQRLNQIDMACGDNILDLFDHFLVTDNILEPVIYIGVAFTHGEVDIDPNWLITLLFMGVDADKGRDQQVMNKDVALGMRGIGDVKRIDVLWHQ